MHANVALALHRCGAAAVPIYDGAWCEYEASGLPVQRPNSMNNAGVLLDELGLSPGLLGPLLRDYLGPLCAALPPLAAAGALVGAAALAAVRRR